MMNHRLECKIENNKTHKFKTRKYSDISIIKDLIHARMIDNITVIKAKLLRKPLARGKTTRHSTQNAFWKNAACKVL